MKEKKERGSGKKVKTFQYGLLLHFFRTADYIARIFLQLEALGT